MQIHTTKEQAERLIELGADAATADMRFTKESKKTPCWTVCELLNLLPASITIEKYEGCNGLTYNVQFNDAVTGASFKTSSQSFFEAVYATVVWWLEYSKASF